jgi:hypothetical protein
MFPVPKSLNNSSQPARGPTLHNRLDCFLQAFRQDLRSSLKVGTQGAFFGSNLVAGNYKRDQRDSYGEDWNQTKAKLHTVTSSRQKAVERCTVYEDLLSGLWLGIVAIGMPRRNSRRSFINR